MIIKKLRRIRTQLTIALAAVGIAAAGSFSPVHAAEIDFGEVGEPIDLVIGYQPYYTQAWSGLVMKDKKFYEKYLPEGSTVEFQIGLQGAIIVNAMLAGKQHIGYMGDMPAIVATTKENVADIRIVATVGLGLDQCNNLLVRTDAPEFANADEAIKWMDGKVVAVPKGACTDRFTRAVFEKKGVTPDQYLNQNIEVITSGFRAGKLDAAAIWEPTAARLVEEGLARKVATGASVDENDGGFLDMRADLIEQRPDVVKAWLNAELDAQLYMADPANTMSIVKMAEEQTTGFEPKVLWQSMVGSTPENQGGTKIRNQLAYAITPEARNLIDKATVFLHSIKTIRVDKLRDEAVMTEFTEEILKERGLTAPVGDMPAQPDSAFTGS